MQTIYEPHPVSPERKAELRAQGFKIVDARFAPDADEAKPEMEAASEPVPAKRRPGRPRKVTD